MDDIQNICPRNHGLRPRGELQLEGLRFLQSQELVSAIFADYDASHSRVLQLLNRAESLQLTLQLTLPPQTDAGPLLLDPTLEEENRAPPSPGLAEIEEEPDPSQSSVIGFDTIRNQLQSLKRAVKAEQSRRYSQHGSRSGPPNPPLKPRAHQLQPPPPTPEPSWRAPLVGETLRLFTAPEYNYRGPRPSILNITRGDPWELARLKIALENLLPPERTVTVKYQILLYHLQLEEAKLIADAYFYSTTPFCNTMKTLNTKLMETPDIRRGDAAAFARFAIQIQSLVGILKTLGPDGAVELQCGSYVTRLLSKLPAEQRVEFYRYMCNRPDQIGTLEDLAKWLEDESSCLDLVRLPTPRSITEKQVEDLLKKLERLQWEKQCKICMDRDICMVFVPCGHLVSCQYCSGVLINCPICCRAITQKIKTYIS